jgi:hypothetical protein
MGHGPGPLRSYSLGLLKGKNSCIVFFLSKGNLNGHPLVMIFQNSSHGVANAFCVLIVFFLVNK